MMFFFSKRCTVPVASSPLRVLNSLKMLSRSASRTRWMMFCLAACAAIRPNFSDGSFASSSSPTSASGSMLRRASSSVTSFSASWTVSTTMRISNSSTSPISGFHCASIFFSGP